MNLKRYLRWELVLALSLVGCTSIAPTLPRGGNTVDGATVMPSAQAQGGNLFFQIRWPERQGLTTQTIPDTAALVEVTVRKGDGSAIPGGFQSVTRPKDGSAVSVVTFKLDPALGSVNVYVSVKDEHGNEVAYGEQLGVELRDNTSSHVTLTLEDSTVVKLRVGKQLDLLRDLKNYFSDYDKFLQYGDSPEVHDAANACQAMFGRIGFGAPVAPTTTVPGPPPNEIPGPQPAPYRVQSTPELVHLVDTSGSQMAADILGNELKALYWPGYVADATFNKGVALHTLDLAARPAGVGGDQTRANLHAEVEAGSWVTEPMMTFNLTGAVEGVSGTVTKQVVLLGGERPEINTLKSGKLTASLDPNGIQSGRVSAEVGVDGVQDVADSALLKMIMQYAGPYATLPTTRLPLHGLAALSLPSIQATADARVTPDLMGASLDSTVRLRKNNSEVFGLFQLVTGGRVELGKLNGQDTITAATGTFRMDDSERNIRLDGSVRFEAQPPKATIKAKFVDIPSNTVLGTVDHVMGPDSDFNRLSSWPELVLMDNQDPAKRTRYRLTPGFFNGLKTGVIRVEVQ